MVETGVVHGRFQVMHMGYMEYILAAKMRCRKLIVGIGNPDMTHLQFNRFQKGGMREKTNPFTYYEKMQMIRLALADFGIKGDEVEFTPFPLDTPKLLGNYVPDNAVFYMTVFDDWALEKKELLEEKMGYHTEILREGKEEEKKITSLLVLKTMASGGSWESMVPRSVAQYIKDHRLDKRVRELWRAADEDREAAYDPLDDIVIERLDTDPEPMPRK